jgi:hypothetical protein
VPLSVHVMASNCAWRVRLRTGRAAHAYPRILPYWTALHKLVFNACGSLIQQLHTPGLCQKLTVLVLLWQNRPQHAIDLLVSEGYIDL